MGGKAGLTDSQIFTFKNELMEILNQSQKEQIAETAESIIAEDFTSKPGWNWPPTSAKRMVFTMESPDCEGDIEVYIFIKRVESEDNED